MKNPRQLAVLIILPLLGLIGMGMFYKSTLDAHRAEVSSLRDSHARAQAELETRHAATVQAQAAEHESMVKDMTAEFESKLDGLRKDQRKQMETAFKEFENIFEGNKRTIDYINALEAKVQAGQGVSKAEVDKLALIATGISFLQKEYQKPFAEFRELEKYLSTQVNTAQQKPTASFGFFKRMFSKEFREAEKEYYRNEGAAKAFSEAQQKFTTVYASAQQKMASVSVSGDAQVKKLYDLIDEKNAENSKDLSQFFKNAREALKTHQEVLDLAPPPQPTAAPQLQP
jgi:hypothetical protein